MVNTSPGLSILGFEVEALQSYANNLELSDLLAPLMLSRAVAENLACDGITGALLILRQAPRPTLAVIGRFDETQGAYLKARARHLQQLCHNLHYVSYRQAEKDCRVLADRLRARLGDDLNRFYFQAMPRGGMVILGLLAYCLNLDRQRFEPPFPPDAPLVVVDDCALTGARLASFLARQAGPRVVFAPLYAPDQLRDAIQRQEKRVIACVSAHDLEVANDEVPGQLETLEQWQAHLPGKRYWVGNPEHVCFPWNEPDTFFWNAASARAEKNWHILPGELCLKNRLPEQITPVPLQIQPDGDGLFKPAEHVVYGDYEGGVVIGQLEDGRVIGLENTAAAMWRALISSASIEAAVDRLQNEYMVDETALTADLHDFIEKLLGRGIIKEN
ncbi:MAG TPA: PqqD family protein [Anaerolineales bacterium]|nr:PqqD family protein [Anaerolineales bacterium]